VAVENVVFKSGGEKSAEGGLNSEESIVVSEEKSGLDASSLLLRNIAPSNTLSIRCATFATRHDGNQ